MRRAAGALVAAVALCAAVPSCRDSASCDSCGTLLVAVTADADVLVPAFSRTTMGPQVGDQLFLKLADLGLDLNTLGDSGFRPQLARAWTFEDSLTLSFEIDPRARWQDGAPVNAHDIAFTFAVYADPAAGAPARTLLAEISSVTARDDRVAVFRFKHRYAEQFYDATYHMRILPRHLLDSIPRTRLASHPFMRQPIGNGPYRFVSWRANESIELAADTAFFLGRPGISRVVWRINSGAFETALTQLVAGEADFMEYLGGPENVTRARGAEHLRIVKYTSPGYAYLGLNLWDPRDLKRPHPIFGDREMRRALSQAVDRNAIRETVFGEYAALALGPTSRLTAIGNDSTLPRIDPDPVAAQSTFERLGWRDSDGDGFRERQGRKLGFTIIYPTSSDTRRRAALMLQEQLKQVGVDAEVVGQELNIFSTSQHSRKFDAALITWNDDPTPSTIRQTWLSRAIGDVNYVGYGNPRFDALIMRAVYAPDRATAMARYHDAFTVIIEDAPGIWLWNPIQAAGIDRRYDNVTIRPDQWSATLAEWRVAPGEQTARDRVVATARPD